MLRRCENIFFWGVSLTAAVVVAIVVVGEWDTYAVKKEDIIYLTYSSATVVIRMSVVEITLKNFNFLKKYYHNENGGNSLSPKGGTDRLLLEPRRIATAACIYQWL